MVAQKQKVAIIGSGNWYVSNMVFGEHMANTCTGAVLLLRLPVGFEIGLH